MSYETYSSVKVVEIDDVLYKHQIKEFGDPSGESSTNKIIDKTDKKISTIVYTDGKLIGVGSRAFEIDKYYIKGRVYKPVTHLIRKHLHILDANYIVKIIVAEEVLNISNRGKGIFKVIKDIKIELKDKNNNEAIKNAKETVRSIREEYESNNSIWDIFFKKQTKGSLLYENVGDNIYSLKQRIR